MTPITALAASLLTALYFKAAMVVIKLRRNDRISMGDAGNESLQRAIRAQANLIEYAPIGLILLLVLELNHAPRWLVLIPAATFIAGRWIHWNGFHKDDLDLKSRVLGMKLTLFSMLGLAVLNVLWVVYRLVF